MQFHLNEIASRFFVFLSPRCDVFRYVTQKFRPVTAKEEKQSKEIFGFEGFFPITVDKAGILCYNKYLV